MPKVVDPQERAREIVNAAVTVLANGGFAKFTLRNLAQEMGGSVTLITHYFANRAQLIDGIVRSNEHDIDLLNQELDNIREPIDRLRRLIEWAIPLDEWSLTMERARIALLAHRDADPAVDAFFVRLEPAMRGVFQAHVAELVDEDDLELTVDLMRASINGITLSAIEHPEIWDRERQLRAAERFLAMLPLREAVTLAAPARSR
jgi:AcrR family transcriptional regulator